MYDPIRIAGGDEPKYGVLQKIERDWAEFLANVLPEDIRQQCTSDNMEILHRVFVAGYSYGRKAK